jgi:hypothetical protein
MVWPYSGSFENYMAKLRAGEILGASPLNSTRPGFGNSSIVHANETLNSLHNRQAGGYWLPTLASKHGVVSHLPSANNRNTTDAPGSNPWRGAVMSSIEM